jgi:hypothetical protein
MDALPHVVAAQPHGDGDIAHHRHPDLKWYQATLHASSHRSRRCIRVQGPRRCSLRGIQSSQTRYLRV